MKKIIAVLLTAVLLAAPVMGFDQEANFENVNLEFKAYAEKPVIDGILDEFGYAKVDIGAGDISYGGNDDDLKAAAHAMNFDIYASYDADFVYLLVSMDTKFYNNDGSGAWDQTGVQFGFANVGDDADVFEFMIGRDDSSGELVVTHFTQHMEADEFELTPGTDFAIALDGDRLNHEVRIPASAFFTGGKLEEGKQLTTCIVLCQNNDGYIHVQISSGLSNGRNIAQFATVTLGAAIEKPADPVDEPADEAPVTVADVDSPTPARSPRTNDAGVMALVALMAAAAAGIVVFRRKALR